MSAIPMIDPNVRHVGVSKLRGLNASKLRDLEQTLVIQDNDQPLVVLLAYEKFLEMQHQFTSVLNMVDLFMEKQELEGLRSGLDDLKAGRVRSLSEIEAELSKKK